MKLRLIALAPLLTISLVGVARSQDKPAAPAPGQADAEKKMAEEMAAMQPGPQHKQLAKMAGEWTTATKFTAQAGAAPDETAGAAKITMALDGRFLHEEDSGAMMNMPYSGFRQTGYNNGAKQYEATWTWTLSTSILRMTGTSKDDGKTVTYAASFTESPGSEEKMTVVVKQIDDDHFTVTMDGKYPDGSAGPHLETTYTRKK